MRREASPIACAPVAQAVTTAWLGPRKPCRIDTWPEARLISALGMKNGEILRGPSFSRMSALLPIASRPPMPEPISTPVRFLASSSSGFQPLSLTASSAAAMANRMKSSMRRSSLADITLSGSKARGSPAPPPRPSTRGTTPAMRAGRSSTLKCSIRLTPDLPATSRSHVASAFAASGVTSPMPVMTTRRMRACRALALPLRNELHRVADGLDVFGRIVRNFDAKLFFERHHEFDIVKAVGAQVIDEGSLLGHLLRRGLEMLDHNRLYALKHFRHARLAGAEIDPSPL